MPSRDDRHQRLFREGANFHTAIVRGQRCGEHQVRFACTQPLHHLLARALHEGEPDAGMRGSEPGQQFGDADASHGVQEGQRDVPVFRVGLYEGRPVTQPQLARSSSR
jgi:hypothetical protein